MAPRRFPERLQEPPNCPQEALERAAKEGDAEAAAAEESGEALAAESPTNSSSSSNSSANATVRVKVEKERKDLELLWGALLVCYGTEAEAKAAVQANPQIINPSYTFCNTMIASKEVRGASS